MTFSRMLSLVVVLALAAAGRAQDEPGSAHTAPDGAETTEAWYRFSDQLAGQLAESRRYREAVEEYFACAALRTAEWDKLADAAVLLVNNAAGLPGGLDRETENYNIIEDLIRVAVARGGKGDRRLAYAIGRLRFVDNEWGTAYTMLKAAYADGEGPDPERTKRWLYRATVNRADLLVRAFRVDEAIFDLQNVIENSPPDKDWVVAAKLNLAAAHRRRDERVESERILRELIEDQPDSSHPWNSLGQVLQDQGRLEEAQEAYEKAVSLAVAAGAPYGDIVASLANVLYKQGRLDESETKVQRFLEINRDAPRGLLLMAQLKRDQHDTLEAVRILRRVRRMIPEDLGALTLLQQIHYERDETDEADAVQKQIDALVAATNAELDGEGQAPAPETPPDDGPGGGPGDAGSDPE